MNPDHYSQLTRLLKSTTAIPSIAAPLGPDIDDALEVLSKVGGLVNPAVELEKRDAEDDEGIEDRQGSSSRLLGEVY